MLTLKNIKKTYEQGGEAILDNINLSFNKNEFVSILGCSGAGKSTLLNIIGGLDCKTSGKLLINGKDIYKYDDLNLDYYRKNNVGFIFQNYNLIEHLTVYENVMLPLLLTNSNIISGLLINALDIATLCFCPPERSHILLSFLSLRPVLSSIFKTLLWLFLEFVKRRGSITLVLYFKIII